MIDVMNRREQTTREKIQIGLRFLEGNKVCSIFDRDTIIILQSTPSTMDEVDRLIDPARFLKNSVMHDGPDRTLVPHGTTVISLEQTQGRGSTDTATGEVRKWWSGAGNLMMSRVVYARSHANEIEYLGGFAIAQIIADLVPRGLVELRNNDVLINGRKISGCLVEAKYEARSRNDRSQNINLGVGVNLAVAPDMAKMHDGSEVEATCLKDHDVIIGIAEFVSRFETRFEELLDYRNRHGFTAILQRIGVADGEGQMTLFSRKDGMPIRGTYRGFSATEGNPGVYLHLEGHEPILTKDCTAQATIKGSRVMGSPGPALAAEELNAG